MIVKCVVIMGREASDNKWILTMEEKTYTTSEAAKEIGVSYQTLCNWIGRRGSLPVPKLINVGKKCMHLWTTSDLQRARKFKGTLKRGKETGEQDISCIRFDPLTHYLAVSKI